MNYPEFPDSCLCNICAQLFELCERTSDEAPHLAVLLNGVRGEEGRPLLLPMLDLLTLRDHLGVDLFFEPDSLVYQATPRGP